MQKKYDISLVTCGFSKNFGALLTAYALYKALKNNGYKVLVLDKPQFWSFENVYLDGPTENKLFLKKHVDYYSPSYTKEELVKLNDICPTFIVGSDQLWNYALYGDAGHYTALDFVNDNNKKISYATSFGHDILYITGKEKINLGYFIHRFDAVSVREKSGVNLLKNEYNIDAKLVLDPVFLLTRREYDAIAAESKKKKTKNGYMFCYILDPTKEKIQAIETMSKKLKKRYVVFSYDEYMDYVTKKNFKYYFIKKSKGEDWLYYLKNSDFVFTDSFHGTCFSLIYEKEFVSIKNKDRGEARFNSLIELFGIENDHVEIEDIKNIPHFHPVINFTNLKRRIGRLKKDSLDWLLNAINETKVDSFKSNVYASLTNTLPDIIEERRLISSIAELNLSNGVSIETIVRNMPDNSVLVQNQGTFGDPVINTPAQFGVLTIYKTTDYFVQITFSVMTNKDEKPSFYQAQWIDGRVVDWVKYIDERDVESAINTISRSLQSRFDKLEVDLRMMIEEKLK